MAAKGAKERKPSVRTRLREAEKRYQESQRIVNDLTQEKIKVLRELAATRGKLVEAHEGLQSVGIRNSELHILLLNAQEEASRSKVRAMETEATAERFGKEANDYLARVRALEVEIGQARVELSRVEGKFEAAQGFFESVLSEVTT